jgi:hypothetical protein
MKQSSVELIASQGMWKRRTTVITKSKRGQQLQIDNIGGQYLTKTGDSRQWKLLLYDYKRNQRDILTP